MNVKSRLAAAACALLALPAASLAEDAPSALTCAFDRGTSTTYAGGQFAQVAAAPLAFEISGIDLEGQAAKLHASATGQPASLRIVRALNANHFLEVVNEGFLNLTTVFDRDPAKGVFPAVHSRHFGLLGQPMVAQYHGFCRAKS